MRILWWRLFLAKFIFRHSTIESLLRECRRNSQLRQLCRLQSHYISMNHTNNYVRIVPSSANKVSTKEPDGRRETQADTTAKTYYSNNGTKTTKYHFGFRFHLLADVNYELPLAFKVTPASKGEREVAEEILTESELLLKDTKAVMADKEYDSVEFRKFIEEQGIIAVIPPRHMWKDEESRQYKDTALYYNQDGQVFYRTEDYEMIELVYKGYDQSTDSLCYGFHPKYNDNCIFRINRSEDIRIFPKVSQQSHKFERLYV